jgi:Ser/Thr protein kinase RdoA (MazF antagonist)
MSDMQEYLQTLGIEEIHKLNGFHNDIYMGLYDDVKIIIRVSQRRSLSETMAEINLLKEISEEVKVHRPRQVNHSYIIEKDQYVLSFYSYVEAGDWRQAQLSHQIHFNAGLALGKIHLYTMSKKDYLRNRYDQHPDLKLVDYLDQSIQDACKETLTKINHIDKTNQSFGLIHGDYLYSNLLYQNQEVIVIDFDDIEYNYYIYDVAVYMFYLLLGGKPNQMDIEPNIEVFKNFMEGYRSVNKETILPLDQIQTFFRLRQIKLYATIKQMDRSKQGPWQKQYIEMTDNQIKNKQDFIEIDYNAILGHK